jgi:hypothetical protein
MDSPAQQDILDYSKNSVVQRCQVGVFACVNDESYFYRKGSTALETNSIGCLQSEKRHARFHSLCSRRFRDAIR